MNDKVHGISSLFCNNVIFSKHNNNRGYNFKTILRYCFTENENVCEVFKMTPCEVSFEMWSLWKMKYVMKHEMWRCTLWFLWETFDNIVMN